MHRILFLFLFSALCATQIAIRSEILTVEIADTPETQAQGLMFRKELPEGHGMLFIYPTTDRKWFWMKNTLIPLSLGFFNEERALIQIVDMDPPKPNQPLIRYPSKNAIRYALEVPQGWFEQHGIELGAKFSFLDQADQVK